MFAHLTVLIQAVAVGSHFVTVPILMHAETSPPCCADIGADDYSMLPGAGENLRDDGGIATERH